MAYTPHTWTTGETVDAAKLNANEQGIQAAAAAADTANAGLSGKVNSSTYTAGLAGKADQPTGGTDGQALVKAGSTTAWATVSGGTTPDATSTVKGAVQLAGDLGGTAAAPMVAKIGGVTPAAVATSGSYADLTNKPTIPAGLPTQTGNAGKFLTTDGSSASWGTPAGGGGTTLPAPGYDIVLLVGQSNMNGYTGAGTAAPNTFDPVTEQVRAWPASGANAGQVVLASDPLAYEDTNAAIGVGPGMAFARWYAQANPTRKLLLVPAAYGGTGFASPLPNTWDTTAGAGSLYERAITRANAAVTAAQAIAPTSKLAAILWHQGENEAWSNWTQDQYATALDALIDGFRSRITGATSSTPFILGRMVPDWIGTSGSGTSPAIDAAHADTPRRKPYTAVINGPAGVNDPGNVYHYLAPGQRINGERMFFALAAAQANTGSATVVPDAPQKVTLTTGTTSMTLAWLAAISGSSAVTGYEVWRGTAAGAETLLTTVSATTFAYTDNAVTSGTTYYYKIRAVSAAGNGAYSAEVSAAPSAVTMIAADTFNRANTANTANACTLGTTDTGGKTWVYRAGYNIYVSNNQALLVGANGTASICATVDAGVADVDVQANWNSTAPAGDTPGITARYVDESNFIALQPYSTTQYTLAKVVAGTVTQIPGGYVNVTPATGDRLRLTVKGTAVTAYINGAQVATGTVSDSALASSTLVGLRAKGGGYTAYLDNFQVTTAP